MGAVTLRIRSSAYVESAEACGARWWSVIGRHVLAHAAAVNALGALDFGFAVLTVPGVGFRGHGAELPPPEWGLLLADGCEYLATSSPLGWA
ncbi:hypothetical protein [Streptomyces sp. NPDC056549]|uniref:hypothetical protein n=1 Tax=Streptomyces sp. NPDC056549 TaxID=3345864 RepID=UPI0036B4D4A1